MSANSLPPENQGMRAMCGTEASLATFPDDTLLHFAQSGEVNATDSLLRRHLPFLLDYAEQLCGDPNTAQDLCQTACLKAISKLSQLTSADLFCPWVKAFIRNEIRHWKRNIKKSGTAVPLLGIYLSEARSVEPDRHSSGDMKYLMDLLREKAGAMTSSCRKTATFMLGHWVQQQEFPSVELIAQATESTHGTAQRNCARTLLAWRQMLRASEFARQFAAQPLPKPNHYNNT